MSPTRSPMMTSWLLSGPRCRRRYVGSGKAGIGGGDDYRGITPNSDCDLPSGRLPATGRPPADNAASRGSPRRSSIPASMPGRSSRLLLRRERPHHHAENRRARGVGGHDVGGISTATLMVFASCCALSSVRSAANETVESGRGRLCSRRDGGRGSVRHAGGWSVRVCLDAVELRRERVGRRPSPGNVTGLIESLRPRTESIPREEVPEILRSFSPQRSIERRAFPGSTKVTSFAASSARACAIGSDYRKRRVPSASAPRRRACSSRIAITQAESAFGNRARR